MRIIFHGTNAASFADGFAGLLGHEAEIVILPDKLADDVQRAAYAEAEVIIGAWYDSSLPLPRALRLFHVPGAGFDAVDLTRLPQGAIVCNCHGHEQAIAEYVM